MLYKPTYCCDCGDRIERIEWNLLTSRRFCEICETGHKFDDWVGKLVATGLVFIGIFGTGTYLSSGRSTLEISNTNRGESVSLKSAKIREISKEAPSKTNDISEVKKESSVSVETDAGKLSDLHSSPTVEKASTQNIARKQRVQKVTSEPVYFCGAETKKGSPCSRKVKGGGRCWQHEGKEAMLPKPELLIKK